MRTGLLGLGSNVGERRAHLQGAVAGAARRRRGGARVLLHLRHRPGRRGDSTSRASSTPACWCAPRCSRWSCSPRSRRSSASSAAGRRRRATGRARSTSTSCCWGSCELHHELMTLPHEQLLRRRFVLIPALELDFGADHPRRRAPGRRARRARRRARASAGRGRRWSSGRAPLARGDGLPDPPGPRVRRGARAGVDASSGRRAPGSTAPAARPAALRPRSGGK